MPSKQWYALATKGHGSKKLSKRSTLVNPRKKHKMRKSLYRTIINGPREFGRDVFKTVKNEAAPVALGAALGFGTPALIRLALKLSGKLSFLKPIETTIMKPQWLPLTRLLVISAAALAIKPLQVRFLKNAMVDEITTKGLKYAVIINAALAFRSYLQMYLPNQAGFLSGSYDEVGNPELYQDEGFQDLAGLQREGMTGLQSEGMNGLQSEGMGGLLPEHSGMSGLENIGEQGLGEDETPEYSDDESGIL
jgi:hypothetical protein